MGTALAFLAFPLATCSASPLGRFRGRRGAVGLHECRHTYAALMIAAGVNAKALSTYMGHSTITVSLDRYGHLMPGSEGEAAGLLDAYLEREAQRPPLGSAVPTL